MSLKKYTEQEFDVHRLVVKLLKQLFEKNFKPRRINCAADIKFDPYFKKKTNHVWDCFAQQAAEIFIWLGRVQRDRQKHQRMDPRTCLLPAEQGGNKDCGAPGSTEAGGETPSDPSILSCEWGQLGSLPAASSL